MTRSAWCAAALLCASIAWSAPAGAQQADSGALARVGWLTGCWVGSAGSQAVEEHWLPLRAGTLVGAGRATQQDRTTSVELMIIRMRGDTLAFHAFPVGQAPAVFPAESVTDSAVAFANPAHDFPQRISYRRVGGDSLVARIEGPGDDGPQGFDYHLRREACASHGAR